MRFTEPGARSLEADLARQQRNATAAALRLRERRAVLGGFTAPVLGT